MPKPWWLAGGSRLPAVSCATVRSRLKNANLALGSSPVLASTSISTASTASTDSSSSVSPCKVRSCCASCLRSGRTCGGTRQGEVTDRHDRHGPSKAAHTMLAFVFVLAFSGMRPKSIVGKPTRGAGSGSERATGSTPDAHSAGQRRCYVKSKRRRKSLQQLRIVLAYTTPDPTRFG